MNASLVLASIAAVILVAGLACTVVMTRPRPRYDWQPRSNDELLKLFYRRYAAYLVGAGQERASLAEDVLQLQLIEMRRKAHLSMLEQESPLRLVCTRRAHRATPVLTVVGANPALRESDAAANRLNSGSRGIAPRAVRGSGRTA